MNIKEDEHASQALPLISVIVPAYNCAAYLGSALDSIFAQSYPQLEVLVVDDGSTDGTVAVAQRYGERVRVISQTNAGPAAARNRGLASARGEFIAFLDGDDLWLEGKLLQQARYLLRRPEASIVYGHFHRWESRPDGSFSPADEFATGATEESLDPALSGWIYHRLLIDSEVHIITALIRATVIDEIGIFDETLKVGEDYDFWLRVSRRFQLYKLARPLALYRIHGNNTTATPRTVNHGYGVLRKNLQQWGLCGPDGRCADKKKMNQRLAQLCFDLGYAHYWHGDRRLALRQFALALKHQPSLLKSWGYFGLALARAAQPSKFTLKRGPRDTIQPADER